ncbi:hypothetical protein M0805_009741 [Coniferiporia weirii]|nr:hypothetical protein M0805_009741 [Coniferiporia weirii]
MNSCSTEIVHHIFSYACAGPHGGWVARSLRLVSKRYSAIASPLEFRSLVISGPRQLETTLARLQKALELGVGRIDVRHLFISDYSAEHALALETPQSAEGALFEETEVGRVALAVYRDIESAFWSSIANIIRNTSSTLVTLTLLSFNSVPERWSPFNGEARGRILAALRGLSFPALRALTIKHSVVVVTPDMNSAAEVAAAQAARSSRWATPSAPVLERLQIVDSCHIFSCSNTSRLAYPHPLLNKFHARYPLLSHLRLCAANIRQLSPLANVICGLGTTANDQLPDDGRLEQEGNQPSAMDFVANKKLPGNLSSVEMIIKHPPEARRWDELNVFLSQRRSLEFADLIEEQDIKGLRIQSPFSTPWPTTGLREYETLLMRWEYLANDADGIEVHFF